MDSQQSFQDFMLGGRGKAGPPTPLPVGRNTPTPSKKKKNNNNKKTTRQNYGPTLKAFQGRVQEWKDLDDQLYQVLNSIVNLRNRIWWETKSLRKKSNKSSSKPWHSSGYRRHNDSSCLVAGDIQMALSHDLLQHEKMLSATRMLISSMAQVQDGMGRRLDELYQLLLEDSVGSSSSSSTTTTILHQVQEIYLLLGAELYRKQLLVSKTVESCNDGLLYMDDDTELVEGDLSTEEQEYSNPRNVAKNCHDNWRLRGIKKKDWNLVENFLIGKKAL